MVLIFLKKQVYTQRMQMILYFFLKTKNLYIFSKVSGLKPNKIKCEIAGLGALKGIKLAFFGMECIDLMFNVITLESQIIVPPP